MNYHSLNFIKAKKGGRVCMFNYVFNYRAPNSQYIDNQLHSRLV